MNFPAPELAASIPASQICLRQRSETTLSAAVRNCMRQRGFSLRRVLCGRRAPPAPLEHRPAPLFGACRAHRRHRLSSHKMSAPLAPVCRCKYASSTGSRPAWLPDKDTTVARSRGEIGAAQLGTRIVCWRQPIECIFAALWRWLERGVTSRFEVG